MLFSLSSPLEAELAHDIRDMAPPAEMVRFIKTGGDAMSACVRIARAVTGRDLIVITGYYGWHDAFSAVQPSGPVANSPGVPQAVKALSLTCPHGDSEALASLKSSLPTPGKTESSVARRW